MKSLKFLIFIAMFLFSTVGPASAFAIFEDDFNSYNGENGALNYNFSDGDAKWSVTSGTVDLIGNGFYDFLPGNGLYIDMDGSTGTAGEIKSSLINLIPGSYILSFDLAGNQRNNSQEQVSIMVETGIFSEVYSMSQDEPFHTFTANFTLSNRQEINIIFKGTGGDNIGMLLDNVKLEEASPVPIPGSILLLGSTLIGIIGYRKKSKG